jgi:hypothetical protein
MQGNPIEVGFCSRTGINCLSCYSTIYQRCHVNLIEKPVKEYSLDRRYQSEDELFKKLPAIQNDQYNYIFLISPLTDGTRASSTASLYIIAYATSMLAGYDPSS